MRSVKTKILAIVISCIVLSASAVGSASIINSKRVVAEDSVQIMNLLCENKANEINTIFSKIQQSVDTLTVYATQQLGSMELFKTDDSYVEAYGESLVNVAVNAAETTEGVSMVYVRFNPEFTSPVAGFFYGKDITDGTFKSLPITNLADYHPSDYAHVVWFYEPVNKRAKTWIAPYYNKNVNIDMISYVVPYYLDDELVGVVGMDIDFDLLRTVVSDTKVYNSGYTFLTDSKAKIVGHQDLDMGTELTRHNDGEFRDMALMLQNNMDNGSQLISYTYEGIPKEAAFRSLVNGMRLVLTAPVSEIDQQATKLIWQIVGAVVIIVSIAVIFTILFTKKLVKPLLELTEAAKKIAEGDLSVSITHQSSDEIGELAESFRQTVVHLHHHISYINELAYRDPLTGVKNKTAYLEVIAKLEEEARLKHPQYAVIVFDINGLKLINDTMGHNFGDILIINACKIISGVFKRSPVYRIGGDEFVVLLEHTDYDSYQTLLLQLQHEIDVYNDNILNDIKVSVAWGFAIYGGEMDLTYDDVFRRADSAMYRRKEEMKKAAKAETK